MNPTVSIIIPIYNAEKNLRRCIESVLKQEYTNFELILVDDGSSDSSGAICDEYREKEHRIRVIHKKNTGVSDSRNIGISMAQGQYIQFLDSDDWITSEATGLMVRMAEEHHCDMVISDFYRVVGERVSHKGDIPEEGVLSRVEFASYMLEKPADFYYGVLWNKLYKREIIEKHQLRMDKDISWCEDFMFNLEYIRHIEQVYVSRVPFYYYVKTKGSLVSHNMGMSKTVQMKRTVFQCYNAFCKDIFDEDDYEKNRIYVYRFLVDAAADGIVPPTILPGTFKLGSERIQVSVDALDGEGMLLDLYRERKLLDRRLQIVALKNELTLEEMKLILYLSQSYKIFDLKEASEVLNVSKREVRRAVSKLEAKKLIEVKGQRGKKNPEEKREKEKKTKNDKGIKGENLRKEDKKVKEEKDLEPITEIALLPMTETILKELAEEINRLEQMKLAGFSEEELEQYALLSERVKQNIRNSLK